MTTEHDQPKTDLEVRTLWQQKLGELLTEAERQKLHLYTDIVELCVQRKLTPEAAVEELRGLMRPIAPALYDTPGHGYDESSYGADERTEQPVTPPTIEAKPRPFLCDDPSSLCDDPSSVLAE